MSSINYDLRKIKAFVFDVDGVLSNNIAQLNSEGIPVRTANIKDGYAIQLAVKKGFTVGIITGAFDKCISLRYSALGVKHIYLGSKIKLDDYKDFMIKTGLEDEEVLYCGDDIPDSEVMSTVGLPVTPADGAREIKNIARYISTYCGGYGVARDVIEQTMRAQDLWTSEESLVW